MRPVALGAIFAIAVLTGLAPTRNGVAAPGFETVAASAWNRAAVERVLHVFAYGGRVSEAQILKWVALGPTPAIQEMLTFAPSNPHLAPPVDALAHAADSLGRLQSVLETGDTIGTLCPSVQSAFASYVPAGGEVFYSYNAVQRTWLAAAHLRGANPFRHKIGLWLSNYLMVSSLQFTKIHLIRDHYDAALQGLSDGAPFWQVLAEGASSAAIAFEYGHRLGTFNNATGKFSGSDDFAREFHQLFFKINGVADGAAYHEGVTIPNTARLLTGMAIDKVPPPAGVPLRGDNWWTAPIDFTDHIDGSGARLQNLSNHHQAPLEILGTTIAGATAADKLSELARVAILHPESLDNLPVEIIRFIGDDNLTTQKIERIRRAWRDVVGTENDLLKFLRSYATSTSFHSPDTFKYMTPFDHTIIAWNVTNLSNHEFYTTYSVPLAPLSAMNAMPFSPVFRIFGHQTGLSSANDSSIFRSAYNGATATMGPADSEIACRDARGGTMWTWRREWGQIIPANSRGTYLVRDVARWLWQRLTGDSGANYTILERAHLAAILARRTDLAKVIDPTGRRANTVYRTRELQREPLASLIAALEATRLELKSTDQATRSRANTSVAMAVNFIRATPYAFAVEGR